MLPREDEPTSAPPAPYLYSVSLSDRSLSPTQRQLVVPALEQTFQGLLPVIDTWEGGGHTYWKVSLICSSETLVEALGEFTSHGEEMRERLYVEEGQRVAFAISVRDIGIPLEESIPPVHTPRRIKG